MSDTYNVPHAGMYNVAPAMPDYTPVNPPAYEPPVANPPVTGSDNRIPANKRLPEMFYGDMINQGEAWDPGIIPDAELQEKRADVLPSTLAALMIGGPALLVGPGSGLAAKGATAAGFDVGLSTLSTSFGALKPIFSLYPDAPYTIRDRALRQQELEEKLRQEILRRQQGIY